MLATAASYKGEDSQAFRTMYRSWVSTHMRAACCLLSIIYHFTRTKQANGWSCHHWPWYKPWTMGSHDHAIGVTTQSYTCTRLDRIILHDARHSTRLCTASLYSPAPNVCWLMHEDLLSIYSISNEQHDMFVLLCFQQATQLVMSAVTCNTCLARCAAT